MIEIRDYMGPVVWLLPPNFIICKIEEVVDEDVETLEEEETPRDDNQKQE